MRRQNHPIDVTRPESAECVVSWPLELDDSDEFDVELAESIERALNRFHVVEPD